MKGVRSVYTKQLITFVNLFLWYIYVFLALFPSEKTVWQEARWFVKLLTLNTLRIYKQCNHEDIYMFYLWKIGKKL